MAYYFPEGSFGPICDLPPTEQDLNYSSRSALDDTARGIDDGREVVYGNPPELFIELDRVLGVDIGSSDDGRAYGLWYLETRCKKRTLSDGSIEYYDCQDEFTTEPYVLPLPTDYTEEIKRLELGENFFVPKMNPEACSPFEPDINIRPRKVYAPNGTIITKTATEGSSPVTFPVTSENESIPNNSTITATFDATSANLVIGGTGSGIVQIKLEWNDRTTTAGVAVDNIQIGSTTWTQVGRSGSESHSLELSTGTYPITYTGLNAANNPIVQNSNAELCLKDGDGSDCNARFTITDVLAATPTTNINGQWNAEANKYGVWTNPATCTLPLVPQVVTYRVPITEADTYGFEFACDDTGTLTLGDSTSALITATGGMFENGSNTTPYTATASLSVGIATITVNCTNSAGGFTDSNGLPTGNAYKWDRNPGGWYIKMCKGGVCTSATSIAWIASGPHPLWSSFMNTYAVFPSNQDPLLDSAQTATYNINIPTTGNYDFECQADNTATFTLDGTQIATSSSFTSSTTTTLSNLSAGGHTLVVSVTNVTDTNPSSGNTWTDNPGGAAWTISQSGVIIASSLDLSVQSDGNLFWDTRRATGYTYTTT